MYNKSSYCNYISMQVRKDNVKTLYGNATIEFSYVSVSHTVIMENITVMLMMITVN